MNRPHKIPLVRPTHLMGVLVFLILISMIVSGCVSNHSNTQTIIPSTSTPSLTPTSSTLVPSTTITPIAVPSSTAGHSGNLTDLSLSGQGHMIDAFDTTDRGTIYIDATGNTIEQKMRGSPSVVSTVSPVVGQEYIPKYLFPAGNWYHTSMGATNSMERVI